MCILIKGHCDEYHDIYNTILYITNKSIYIMDIPCNVINTLSIRITTIRESLLSRCYIYIYWEHICTYIFIKIYMNRHRYNSSLTQINEG